MGLGIQAAATSCNLDFIPATKERFDLVIPINNYRSQTFAPIAAHCPERRVQKGGQGDGRL